MRRTRPELEWTVLTSPVRREILAMLAAAEQTPSDLLERLPVKQPELSRQLAELRRANLVQWRQEGPHRVYSLNVEGMRALKNQYDTLLDTMLEAAS